MSGIVDELETARLCVVGARLAIERIVDAKPPDAEVLTARLARIDAALGDAIGALSTLTSRRRAQERRRDGVPFSIYLAEPVDPDEAERIRAWLAAALDNLGIAVDRIDFDG